MSRQIYRQGKWDASIKGESGEGEVILVRIEWKTLLL
jgi:hypothetical protein